MKKILITLVVLALSALGLSQSLPPFPAAPQPKPATVEPNVGAHFEVSTAYERLMNGANATVMSARLPLTPRYSFVYSQYQIPTATAQVYLGEVEFREKLSHLISSSAAQIPLDSIQVFARCGLGTKRDDQGNNPAFAYGCHGGPEVQIGQVGGGVLSVGFKVGFLRVPRQPVGPRVFVLSSTAEIAPGVTLRF